LLRLLESRGAVALGSFSYSLYLTHFPLVALCGRMTRSYEAPAELRLGVMLLLAVGLCVPVAYAFHRLFERPTLASAGIGYRPACYQNML
jgi:peptidoglycan/LPS O-acetylase OafA/YrhL